MLSLNKFQALFIGCTGFLVFVCLRSYSPYPEYQAPMTHIVKDQALPDSEVSVEALLDLDPSWLESNRDAFAVHDKYVQKLLEKTEKTDDPDPIIEPPPVPVEDEVKPPPVPEVPLLPTDFIKPKPPKEPKRPVLDLLTSVNPIKVVRPPEPSRVQPKRPAPRPKSPRPGVVPRKPKITEHRPTIRPPTPGGDEPALEPEKPYELPFKLQGIVRADEEKGPFIIVLDKETGKRARRYEGQKYHGVVIRKIGPGTVEIEVPEEDLELRYADTIHKWLPM